MKSVNDIFVASTITYLICLYVIFTLYSEFLFAVEDIM